MRNSARRPPTPVPGGAADRRAWLQAAALTLAGPLSSPLMASGGPAADRRATAATGGAPVGLPPPVQRALQGSGLPLRSFGVHVQPVDGPGVTASLNAESPYVLASTAKVVTALAALELLGPQYRWRTHAFLEGPLVLGRLQGHLVIAGGGNARLSSAELLGWMQRMRAQGLHTIAGDILVDRSAFHLHEDDHRHTPVPGDDRPHHVWPDALSIDQGQLHVLVQPARGPRADVRTVPPLAGVTLVNQVAMQGGGCGAFTQWRTTPAGEHQLVVQGRSAPGCSAQQILLVPPPDLRHTVHAVAGLWRMAGGVLEGRVREVDLTAGNTRRARLPLPGREGEPVLPWSTHVSEPLPVLVREMNKTSNNLAARHLMLSLSRGFPLRPASIDGARQSLQAWLARQGLAPDDLALDNGSGLSREERGKPRALVQLLIHGWRSRESRTFVESLPVAGVDGTLQHRLTQGAATGRAFLKTGTLRDTRALAGYVRGASGRVYAVALLVNHPEAARATPALDAVVEWLARQG